MEAKDVLGEGGLLSERIPGFKPRPQQIAMAEQIAWADAQTGTPAPVGIGAAGLVNPVDGLALTEALAIEIR